MEFQLVPITPGQGVINIQLTESNTQISNFPYEDQDGTNSIQRSFSSNVWPTASGIDRSVQPMAGTAEADVNVAWQSPSNWTSIVNENTTTTGLVRYFRYKNEFVGSVFPNNPSLLNISAPNQLLKAFTSANTPPPTGFNYEAVCEGTEVTNEVYFPSTLISNNSGIGTKPTQDIEISISAAEVNIFSRGSATLNKVQVSDLLGRVVGTYSNINTKQFTIPANPTQHGVYLIKVLDSEGNVSTSKIQR